jgi:hypothetical protein
MGKYGIVNNNNCKKFSEILHERETQDVKNKKLKLKTDYK